MFHNYSLIRENLSQEKKSSEGSGKKLTYKKSKYREVWEKGEKGGAEVTFLAYTKFYILTSVLFIVHGTCTNQKSPSLNGMRLSLFPSPLSLYFSSPWLVCNFLASASAGIIV